MKFKVLIVCLISWTFFSHELCSRLPDLTEKSVQQKTNEILSQHAHYKKLTPELMKRLYKNFLEELDPTKTYFIESDIKEWVDPSDESLNQAIALFNQGNYKSFEDIYKAMLAAVERRHLFEKDIDYNQLPKDVTTEEFKDLTWVKSVDEVKERLIRIRALQVDTASRLNAELKEKSLQRIEKRQSKYEEELLGKDETERKKMIYTKILKALTSSLDTHTSYFTPEEAKQFMINVQQRLFGIGAQLRDDLNGFTVTKIVEGGPAYNSKELKLKDRIIAVNGEPVVGMDILDAVELIRGEENTPVIITVIRETGENDQKKEEKLELTIYRGEVVLKEARYETSYEPFGDGVIANLRLHTFYQDSESSSAQDLTNELEKLKADKNVLGVVLDLRYNSGGLLTQAVAVAGLFISKGIVVSIKDSTGFVQHLRDVDGKKIWDGPLVVLINRVSASAAEIVAQALQDYGIAIIAGDDHSYGKGSFQTFTLNVQSEIPNPEGEYKVTRGRYYTVSGKTPQLTGVLSDIVLPGPLSQAEIGEKYSKYPLESDSIKENFDDSLDDIPPFQREKLKFLYKFDLQKKLNLYEKYLPQLRENAEYRIKNNKNYQSFLKELSKVKDPVEGEEGEQFGQNDLQLTETINVIKDLIYMMEETKLKTSSQKSVNTTVPAI